MGSEKNPLSGAQGGGSGGPPSLASQIGTARPQQQGSTRAPQSVSTGGPILKLDPPSLRGGLVADPNRRPFKLNGMQERPMPDDVPVGSIGDSGDADDDPTSGA